MAKKANLSRIVSRQSVSKLLLIWLLLTPLLAPLTGGLLIAPHEFKYYLSSIAVLVLYALWLMADGLSKQAPMVKTALLYVMGLFLLWAALSTIWALNTTLSWQMWQMWFAAFLLFILVRNSVRNECDITLILGTLSAAASIVAALGIAQHLFDVDWVRQVVKPASFYGNKNMAVHFIVLSVPIALGLMLKTMNRRHLVGYTLMTTLMLIYLLYTQTRAGWLAVFIQGVVLALFIVLDKYRCRKNSALLNKDKVIAMTLTLALVVLAAVFNPSKHHFLQTVTSIGAEANFSATGNPRLASWQNTLAMVGDYPLTGVGLANWRIHYPLYHNRLTAGRLFGENAQLKYVHNDYLTLLSELGIVGFMLLLWLFALVCKRVWRVLINPNHPQRLLVLAMALSLLGFLVNAGFSFPLSMYLPPVVILIYCALIDWCATDKQTHKRLTKSAKRSSGKWYLLGRSSKWYLSGRYGRYLGVICLILAIGLSFYNVRLMHSEDLYFQAQAFEQRRNWQALEDAAAEAYDINPNRIRLSAYLGQAKAHLGKGKESIAYFEKALALNPFNINTMSFFAEALVGVGDYQGAKKMYQQALDIHPKWANVHKNMGVLYMRFLKQPRAAREHFKTALELNPNITQADAMRRFVENASQ